MNRSTWVLFLSKNGSNLNNIEAKQKIAIGIKKDIEYRVKGLGKYTLEGGMVYINSLLRSSILFAAETMYNIKEVEYRLIEKIEKTCLEDCLKLALVAQFFNYILNLVISLP